MGLIPSYRITANDADITHTILARLVSLTLTDKASTDKAGGDADMLTIVLDDSKPERAIRLPPLGAELEVSLGYADNVRRMGLYVCNAIKLSGWPGKMEIGAQAAPWDTTSKGKSELQSEKTRSWPAGTTIKEMLTKIAGEHGMEPKISPSLAEIKLAHIDQTAESDINLLLRLAMHHDAIAKPAGGYLVFARRGESKSVTGVDLPRIVLRPGDVKQWSVNHSARELPGTVVARYYDTYAAALTEVKVGNQAPVRTLPAYYPNVQVAAAAARAEQLRRARRTMVFNIEEMPGRPDLIAEALLVLEGWREDMAGEWLVTSVTHTIDVRGYHCSVAAEWPNTSEAVSGVMQAEALHRVLRPG